ncbi:MAG TPA: hypothetical protein VI911_11390 [Patescibacteria group bacterium]|nr:hypothetical protein [Patescibacteria group bacterium]
MKTIVCIAGVKTSGKSTATQYIKEYYENKGRQVVEAALADKLKDVCSMAFGIPRNTFDDQRYKEIPFRIFNFKQELYSSDIRRVISSFGYDISLPEIAEKFKNIVGMELESARHIAQIVGTQVLRAMGDEDIHCKNLELGEDVTLISDARFPNEYNYFSNKEGYKFIPLYLAREKAESQVTKDSHVSETSVFLFKDKCIKVDNNGTREQTKQELFNILDKVNCNL